MHKGRLLSRFSVVLTELITDVASVVGMAAAVSSNMVARCSSRSTAHTQALTTRAKGALRAGVKTEVTSVASFTYTHAIFLLALTEHEHKSNISL